MDKKKVLVKIHPEGKYIIDIDPKLNMDVLKPSTRVALKWWVTYLSITWFLGRIRIEHKYKKSRLKSKL